MVLQETIENITESTYLPPWSLSAEKVKLLYQTWALRYDTSSAYLLNVAIIILL